MSESLYYKLGKGSIKEAKDVLRRLLPDIGEIGPYLDNDDGLENAYRELLILSNIRFLEGEEEEPGSIKLDFFRSYLKSRRKLVVSDEEIEKASKEEELL